MTRSAILARTWRILWISALVVVVTPLVLVPLYRLLPPTSTLMVWAAASGQGFERTWVSLDEIAPVLVASVLVSEDSRYCAHRGVDWDELNKVIDQGGDRPRGASTISMQTARNLFLWPSRSYVRKALEIPLALYGDYVWGKRRQMEIYLNIAEWGPGIFGVGAAANHYFGTPAGELNARQASLLAAALPNPIARDPANPSALHRSLAATVAARARGAGPYVDCLRPPAPV